MFQKKATGKKYPVHHNVLSESDKSYFLSCVDLLGSKKKDNFEAGVICAEVNMVNSLFTKIYFKK